MHIIRNERPMPVAILIRIVSIVIALILCGLLIITVTGLNPLAVFQSMIKGTFGSTKRLINCLRDASFLWLIAIGLSPAFKMRFWNTGAEGQILIGGVVSAAIMIAFDGKLPNIVVLLLMLAASILSGLLMGFVPAYFQVRFRTNETLFTLMMNYITIQVVEFMVDIWDKKQSHSVGVINPDTKTGWFPKLFNNQYGWVFVIVLAIAIIMYVYLNYAKQGYEIDVVGSSENTAAYAGINVGRTKIRTVMLSSAICALAGFIQTAGVSHTISLNTAGGKGFTAIIVAWLGKFDIAIMAFMSFLIEFLEKGANQIASQFNFNEYGADVLIGIILFSLLSSEFFCNYQIVFKRKGGN